MKRTTDEKVQIAISTTKHSLNAEFEKLKSHAKTMITHAKQAQEFLDALEAGESFYAGFFAFEGENCRKAMDALAAIDGLRNAMSALEFITRNDDKQ